MENCLFCKIAAGIIPSSKVYEDEKVLAFNDIDPQAPTHFLVIPKEHITGAGEITEENSGIVAYIFEVIAKIAKEKGEFPCPSCGVYVSSSKEKCPKCKSSLEHITITTKK